ncbi:MAG: PAS domain S-box protein, partial [Bryobacteraceae bacterium]
MERTDFEKWNAKEVARLLALAEGERRYYQDILASLPIPLVSISADRAIVSSNRAFRRVFGLRPEDLVQKRIDEILPSEQLIERIRQAHVGGIEPPATTVEIGERRFRVTAVPMRHGGEVETLLSFEELSASVESPATPARSEEIPAILWRADRSSLAFTSVTGALGILGYTAAHWLRGPGFFRERIHPEDRALAAAFLENAIARGAQASAEFRARSASGGVVWCRETIRVNGQTVSGILIDITERKQVERQSIAAERSSALHTLASRLAHDLNNPLMIVTGYTEELLAAVPEAGREDARQILTAAERISAIAERLTSFTRRLANPSKPVDISVLLAGLKDKIAVAAGVPVNVKTSGDRVCGMADSAQMEQVILALVSRGNARERSRIEISCRACTMTEHIPGAALCAGKYACLTIEDDGPDTGEAIFESMLDPKDALARAYSMVCEWGGGIARSSEAQGSIFTIYLPWCNGEPVAPVQAVPQTAEPAGSTAPVILLVEDEAGIRTLIQKILRRENYEVIETASAEQALG